MLKKEFQGFLRLRKYIYLDNFKKKILMILNFNITYYLQNITNFHLILG